MTFCVRRPEDAAGKVGNFGCRLAEDFAVFCLFVALTALAFRVCLPYLTVALIGPAEDNQQDFWNSWYAAVAAKPGSFFETDLIRFPEGALLNYHSFTYPQTAAVILLTKIFGSDRGTLVLLQNLTLLISYPLSGLGAYLLVRRFARHRGAALIGAILFAFNPSHTMHVLHHVGVSQIEVFPFFVYFYLEAFEKRRIGSLTAAALTLALGAMCCWYYLFYLAYFVIFHGAYVAWRTRRRPAGWQLAAPLVVLGGAAVLLSPLIVPMVLQTKAGVYQDGSAVYTADVQAFFTVPPYHWLGWLSRSFYARLDANAWEKTVYLGYASIALMGWLIWRRRGKADATVRYVLCAMAVFAALAAGDLLHAFGYNLGVPMPGILLSHLPFLANARTPSRLVVFVYLFLSVGIGYALTLLLRARPGWGARAFVAGFAAVSLIDLYPAHIALANARCPAGMEIIANDREPGFGVLNLPSDYTAADGAMMQQTCHGKPLVAANLSRFVRPSLIDRLERYDLDRQARQLRAAHVKYIVLDNFYGWQRDPNPPPGPARFETKFDGTFPWFRIVAKPLKPLLPAKDAYLHRYRTIFRSKRLTILAVE